MRCWGDEVARSVDEQMREITKQFDSNFNKEVEEITTQAGRECAKKLRSVSPKRTGKYASGWTAKKQPGGLHGVSSVVYNNKAPGLAHLLEYGHANKGGGRTPAHPHIKSVEQEMSEEYYEKLKHIGG